MSPTLNRTNSSSGQINILNLNTWIIVLFAGIAQSASAGPAYIVVHGAPRNTANVAWYDYAGLSAGASVNAAGIAIGYAYRYSDPQGLDQGTRAVRWDASAFSPVILGDLGVQNSIAFTSALAINAGGTAVGYGYKFDSLGNSLGNHAVRWDPGNATAIDLGALTLGSLSVSQAFAINDAGTAIGYSAKYGASGNDRAVKWNVGAANPIELGNLGLSPSGSTDTYAYAISSAGAIGGKAEKYDLAGNSLGSRPVRWDSNGVATELDTLGTNAIGVANGQVMAISATGNAFGLSQKYDASGTFFGGRTVRWDAGGTAGTELGNLGTTTRDFTVTAVSAINSAGTAVGYAYKWVPTGKSFGKRAVRWDANSTTAIELGTLSVSPTGYSNSAAYSVTDAGDSVGYATLLDSLGNQVGDHAVYWPGDGGNPIDLNDLIDPASGWTLTAAYSISNTNNYIAGIGSFDSDGPGGEPARQTLFLMQVPEPAGVLLLVALAPLLVRRRRSFAVTEQEVANS